MRRNAIWGKIFLTLFSFAFACVVGEVGARLLLPPPAQIANSGFVYKDALGEQRHLPDPEIGWVLSSAPIKSPHRPVAEDGSVIFDVSYSIASGQRSTSKRKMMGPAVICTGCSFTFGHGLPDEDTWPWLLQERLPDYQVLNVASMAYGTDQALLAAERQVSRSAVSARVVVLGFCDFQIDRNRSSQGWLVHLYPFGKPLYLMKGAAPEFKGLVRFYSLPGIFAKSALASHISNRLANERRKITPYQSDDARELTAKLIIQWARQFQSKGIDLVVVILPWKGDHSPASTTNRTYIIESLRAAKIATFVPCIPRLPNGKIDGDLFWISEKDRHPNRNYNKLIAAQISDFLQANVLPASRQD